MADKKIFIGDGPRKPNVNHSTFDLTHVNNMSARFGKVQVCYCKDFPAGSRVNIKPSFAFDMMPLVYPIQTNVRAHLKFYRVPFRVLFDDFEDMWSQVGSDGLPSNQSASPYKMPYIKRPTGWNPVGSLAEQLGCSNLKIVQRQQVRSLSVVYRAISSYGEPQFISSDSSIMPDSFESNLLDLTADNSLRRGLFAPFPSDGSSPIVGTFAGHTGNFNMFDIPFVTRDNTLTFSGSFELFFVKYRKVIVPEDPKPRWIISHKYRLVIPKNGVTSSVGYSVSTYSPLVVNGETLYKSTIVVRAADTDFIDYMRKEVNTGAQYGFLLRFPSSFNNIIVPGLFSENLQQPVSFSQPTLIKDTVQEGSISYSLSNTIKNYSPTLGGNSSINILMDFTDTDINTKYDSIDGADPVEPINALPFRAVEFIHNYFFRNQRIDPFIKDGKPSYNKFLTNTAGGADSTTPVDTWNALYETDYFTSCVKEPQFGNAPLVGVTVNDLSSEGILKFSDGTQTNSYTVKLDINEQGQVLPLSVYSDIADRPNVHRLQDIINFGISINDLRNVSAFQRMLERIQRSGYKYQNVVYEFFGTNPPVGDHYPRYIGGCSRMMSVDKITQIAETEQKKLGEFAAQGRVNGQCPTIKTYCSEQSYIIGLVYFTVTPTYSQYLPKHLIKRDLLDYYVNPDFATMGPQPVYAKELACSQLTDSQQNDVFGYNRPYAEYLSSLDECHGLFLTSLNNFMLHRVFGSKPLLNKSFIEINSADLTNIFSVVEDDDKIFGQILFHSWGSLPFPHSYTPRSI